MKKYTFYFICFLMAVAVTSCKKEKEEDSFLKGQMTDFQGQKAYIDGSNYSCFRRGEPILVNGRNNCTVSTLSNSDRTCNISGAEKSEYGYYAFYPANLISATDISSGFNGATVTLPRVQQYAEENGHQVIDNPMAGHLPNSPSGTIQFHNLCALLKVNVTSNWTLDSIQVTMKGTDLWGTGSVDETSWKIDMDNGATHDTKYETVSLVFPRDGISTSNGMSFYIMVPNNTITADNQAVKVHFYGKFKQIAVHKNHSMVVAQSQQVVHNRIITLNTFSLNEPGIGVFTVNGSGKKVTFAPGTLVENKTTHEWHFPGKPYHGVSTSDYNYYFSYTDNLLNNNDWGWINTVAGNQPHTWRVPTRAELVYVVTANRNAKRNCWYCKVNTINGLIIYPDGCKLTTPSGHTDNIDETVWANTYESVGCIFLPAHHGKSEFNNNNGNGYYTTHPPQKSGGGTDAIEGFYAMSDAYSNGGNSTGYKCFKFTSTGERLENASATGLNGDAKIPSTGVNVRLVHDLPQ